MPFSKIKHSKGATTLTRVEDRSNTDSIEQTLTSYETPRPEFVTAMQALTSWVVRICELPINYAEGMTIIGVSVSLGEYGGCVVTALKKVAGANAPVVINTPHVPETATSDAGPELPPETVRLLNELDDEALKFWNGERAQKDLFDTPAIENEAYQAAATENLREMLERDGARATMSVNGGPQIDMADEAAVMDALAPVVSELLGKAVKP